MPNDITNYVEIKGSAEQMAKLIAKTLKMADGEVEFDFNGIITRPASLNIEAGGRTDIGLAAFRQDYFDRFSGYDWFKERYSQPKTPDEFRAYLASSTDESDREALALGQVAMENIRQYGCPTWYEWSVEHWGTKWNAYDAQILKQEPGRLVIRFDTAWSPPTPIFDQLVADGFEVNAIWQDENDDNYGMYGDPWEVFARRVEYEFLG